MFPNAGFTLGNEAKYFFKIPMLGIKWVFSPQYGKMMGLFFHKLGNISICYSQFREMQGTRNPHLGKGLVKVRVTFSQYCVQFGKICNTDSKIPTLGNQWVYFPKYGKIMGLFFHKLGNIATCYSQFWKMKGTRNPHLGKGFD